MTQSCSSGTRWYLDYTWLKWPLDDWEKIVFKSKRVNIFMTVLMGSSYITENGFGLKGNLQLRRSRNGSQGKFWKIPSPPKCFETSFERSVAHRNATSWFTVNLLKNSGLVRYILCRQVIVDVLQVMSFVGSPLRIIHCAFHCPTVIL